MKAKSVQVIQEAAYRESVTGRTVSIKARPIVHCVGRGCLVCLPMSTSSGRDTFAGVCPCHRFPAALKHPPPLFASVSFLAGAAVQLPRISPGVPRRDAQSGGVFSGLAKSSGVDVEKGKKRRENVIPIVVWPSSRAGVHGRVRCLSSLSKRVFVFGGVRRCLCGAGVSGSLSARV